MNKKERFTGQEVRFKQNGKEYDGEIISIPTSLYGIFHVAVKIDEIPAANQGGVHTLDNVPWQFFIISEEEIIK